MNEVAFAAYLLDTLLHEVFHSKRRMAQELDVTLRTLQLNMRAGECAKGANRATLWAVCYCCKHGIDIQEIYNRFVATKKGGVFQTIEYSRKSIFLIITKMNAENGQTNAPALFSGRDASPTATTFRGKRLLSLGISNALLLL